MYLSILLLPLLGAITSGLLGRKLGVTGAHIITCICMISAALLSILSFYEVALSGSPVSITLSSWIDSGAMSVNWAFMFDSLTVSMLLPVLLVSAMVHVYSISYMSEDPHNQRFFSYLSMFTFFMLILVTGDNYLILFVGWEGKQNCLTCPLSLENFSSLIIFTRQFHLQGKIHSHKRIGPHNINILEIMIGLLLGDGHLEKRSGAIGCRLIVEQTNRNVEYLMWLYNQFLINGYCTNKKPKLFKRIKKNNTVYYGYKFNTFTFSSLNWLHDLFYLHKIKHLPIEFLKEHLSPLILAIWFQDDGNKFQSGYKIATNCFELSELEKLCGTLKSKFDIECSLHSSRKSNDTSFNYTIYIKKSSSAHFANLIKPYMINSMHYKLRLHSQ